MPEVKDNLDRNRKIYEGHLSGKQNQELAKEFGLTYAWVSQIIKKMHMIYGNDPGHDYFAPFSDEVRKAIMHLIEKERTTLTVTRLMRGLVNYKHGDMLVKKDRLIDKEYIASGEDRYFLRQDHVGPRTIELLHELKEALQA